MYWLRLSSPSWCTLWMVPKFNAQNPCLNMIIHFCNIYYLYVTLKISLLLLDNCSNPLLYSAKTRHWVERHAKRSPQRIGRRKRGWRRRRGFTQVMFYGCPLTYVSKSLYELLESRHWAKLYTESGGGGGAERVRGVYSGQVLRMHINLHIWRPVWTPREWELR